MKKWTMTYAPGSDVDLGEDSDMEETGAVNSGS